jgi:hypothetical protein
MAQMHASLSETRPPDLSGRWLVTHVVERSEIDHYVGLELEFNVALTEFGGSLVGSGRKVRVNGVAAEDDEASLLDLSGRITGSAATLSLFERKESGYGAGLLGEIKWTAEGLDKLTGEFRVDVGATAGRSTAIRQT